MWKAIGKALVKAAQWALGNPDVVIGIVKDLQKDKK